jgi:hypothetical protein
MGLQTDGMRALQRARLAGAGLRRALGPAPAAGQAGAGAGGDEGEGEGEEEEWGGEELLPLVIPEDGSELDPEVRLPWRRAASPAEPGCACCPAPPTPPPTPHPHPPSQVLSNLPTSLQLDILEKLRDAQQAANRGKFQQAAAQPAGFSEVQLQTFLKAAAFRQKINRHKEILGGGQQVGRGGAALGRLWGCSGAAFGAAGAAGAAGAGSCAWRLVALST